jgi:hypothetical protein
MATKKKSTKKKKASPKPERANATVKPSKKKAVGSKKSENKTQPTSASVEAFIAKTPNAVRRRDAETLLALMKRLTGETPTMWGPSIVGFGEYRYKYESGREGEMCITGFSPRAAASVVYLIGGVKDDPLFKKLGKHRMGGSCLYINKLDEIDLKTLEALIAKSVAYVRKTYPS